jgi:hypothetical protein
VRKEYEPECAPEKSQARLEADEEGREGRMGICNALARQYGCAVRTPLKAQLQAQLEAAR